jgi:hypothetical protein
MVPKNEHREGCFVPVRLVVGDNRRKADSRAIKRARKRGKDELGVLDEQQFNGRPRLSSSEHFFFA